MDGDSAEPSGRDWTRIGLVVGCILAVGAVVLLMPAFAVDGLAGSPLETILPGESADINSGAGSGSGALGALNPGAGTGVGGEIGLNSEAFGSTSTEVHFTVESSERTYWRTAAYGTYTGSGWERSTETSSVDGRVNHPGPDGERIDYEVTLNKRASAVPTAYRPALIEGIDNPQVTDNGAIKSGSTLEAGTTISGVSFAPRDDVDRLRSTRESYPSEIEQRYTQLPDGTSDRIASRTESVFADAQANDPYEKAVAVQEYLRSSKEYDLSVSERDGSIAETFLFEMDAGYCEYFASTMAVMMRSQDIPARYVVGYSSGQRIDSNTYEVRGMNAHAWVEVYFEGVGWVRFDPTPGNERLEAQQEALEGLNEDFELGEAGSPGEQFTPDGNSDETDEPGDQGLRTSLNQTAIPGAPVELTVTYDATPVSGVDVFFNGERVGTTNQGTVTGRVPDAEELTVTLRENESATPEIWSSVLFGADGEGERAPGQNATMAWDGTAIGRSMVGTPAAGMVATGGQPAVFSTDEQIEQPEDTHPIRRTAAIVVSGKPVPGGELLLTARIDDIVIDGAAVTVDGEEVGQTNESGQAVIELPDTPGDVSIAVERGAVTGQRTVTIPELTMSVKSGTLGPNALGSVTVVAELDGAPASGIPVVVDGEEVAVTGVNGTAEVALPFRPEATLAVEASGQRATKTLTGLLYVPIGASLGLIGVLVGVGYGFRRRGVDWRTIGRQVGVGVKTVFAGIRRGFVALVTDGDRYLGAAGRRLRNGLVATGGVITGKKAVGPLWQRFKHRLGAVRARVTGSASRTENPEASEQLTVREAWDRFLDSISANTATTRTPGELARHAIEEDGLPEQPVTELRDTFRAVEYGHRNASDRLGRVQDAIEQIESER